MRVIPHFGCASVLNDTLADTRYAILLLCPLPPSFNGICKLFITGIWIGFQLIQGILAALED